VAPSGVDVADHDRTLSIVDILPLVIDAMLSLSAPAPAEAERARLASIAASIVDESTRSPLWAGDEGHLATSLALVAIGHHESRFRESVRRCRPRGRYVGMFQILPGRNLEPHTTAAVCESDALQAALALKLLHGTQARCHSCPSAALFRAYVSGNSGADSPQARATISLWVRAAKREGLQVFPHATTSPRWLAARR
jgi:hypothetical protein